MDLLTCWEVRRKGWALSLIRAPSLPLLLCVFIFFYFRRSCLLLGGVTHSPHRSKLIRGDARLMQTFPQRHTLRFSLSLFFLFFFFCTKERWNGKVIQTCLHPALIVSLPMSALFISFLFLCLFSFTSGQGAL